jgi:hypothetical protein
MEDHAVRMKNEFVRMRKEAFDPTFFLRRINIQYFKNKKAKNT